MTQVWLLWVVDGEYSDCSETCDGVYASHAGAATAALAETQRRGGTWEVEERDNGAVSWTGTAGACGYCEVSIFPREVEP